MSAVIERGDVYWAALDPVIGSELAKTRPCVVVSATEVNAARRTVVIVPLTTTTAPPNWPLLIELPTFTAKSRARIEQIRVIDKSRLRQQIDTMDTAAMQQIEMALAVVLGIHRYVSHWLAFRCAVTSHRARLRPPYINWCAARKVSKTQGPSCVAKALVDLARWRTIHLPHTATKVITTVLFQLLVH